MPYRTTLFFIFMLSVAQCDAGNWTFSSYADVKLHQAEFPESGIIAQLQFQSDCGLADSECRYLTDFSEGSSFTREHILKALDRLFQKNCFQYIRFSIDELDEGYAINVFLNSFWRLKKFKIGGVWVGKEWYKQHYLMQPGDRFDRDTHYHAIQKIKNACIAEGYFDTETTSSFSYKKNTREVVAYSHIMRGKRYAIRANHVRIEAEAFTRAEINSLQHILAHHLYRALCHGKYSKKLIEQQASHLKRIVAQKGFFNVAIELEEKIDAKRHAVHLHWTFNVRKKREFIFFGNNFFSSDFLLEKIMAFGRSSWIVPASILSHDIKELYVQKGFWNCAIDARDEDGRSFFVIKEGDRAIIQDVEIQGAVSYNQKKLIKRCFAKLLRKGLFDQSFLDQALDRLKEYYIKHGYRHIEIASHDFIKIGNHTYRLIVSIKEGALIKFYKQIIPGFEDLSCKGPLAETCKRGPVAYDETCIQEQKVWLAEEFRKKGYISCRIQSDLCEQEDEPYVRWNIDPGSKVFFGKTIVTGASDFHVEKIVRELAFKPGEIWDQVKIKQSFKKLRELYIFDSISFVPLQIDPNTCTRDVLLRVHQDDPFELRIRGGLEFQHIRQYQTFAGVAYKIGGTFMVKNPSNNGDLFRFDADVARSHREINIKYKYPWVCGLPLHGVGHAYAIKYEQPGFIGSKKNLYTLYQNGILGGAHYKNSYVDGGINIGFEVLRTTFSDDSLETRGAAIRLARAINFDVRLLDKAIPYFYVEPTIMIDMLDNNVYPTRGTFTLFSLKGMFPTKLQFSQSYFFKMLFEHSWFFPIRSAVAAFRFRFGHIFHRIFSDISPSERFYLGGSHSVRSYEPDLAPPTSIFIDDDGKCHVVPRGGKTMVNMNGELRIPVAAHASFVLFQDVGALCGDLMADFKGMFVAGTGFGMRYHTPVGPLRFDIGWKWRKERPEEGSFNWVLTFGQAF